jgi:hypothetical protein
LVEYFFLPISFGFSLSNIKIMTQSVYPGAVPYSIGRRLLNQ